MYTVPVVADFKSYFTRDFPYGTTPESVMNSDIQTGLNDAGINFNEALWNTQTEYSTAYLLLAAHYMVMNLEASSQGISGKYNWLQASKSVGSVSASYAIPQKILNNPTYAMFSKTKYGAKFLSFILPRLVGQVFTVQGRTKP